MSSITSNFSYISPGKEEIPDVPISGKSQEIDPQALENLATVVAKYLNKPAEKIIGEYRSRFNPQKTFRLVHHIHDKKILLEKVTLTQYAELFNLKDLKEALLQAGIHPAYSFERQGRSLLHGACFFGLIVLMRYLFEQKTNPNIKDKDQNTPLHILIQSPVLDENSKILCASYLINAFRAKLDSANANRETALHLACDQGLPKLIKLLIKAGANTRFPDKNKKLPRERLFRFHPEKKAKLLDTFLQAVHKHSARKKDSASSLNWPSNQETKSAIETMNVDSEMHKGG